MNSIENMPSSASDHKQKRPRTTSSHGDSSEDDEQRPGQAERKRNLERNRRNLINARFAELDQELQACSDNGISNPNSKRIDKEAVLKDACLKLSSQRKELETMRQRVGAMTTEIDNLRLEKVELRSDKQYLKSELDIARKDLPTLRRDNLQLWQSLQKHITLKAFLSPELTKVPVDLFNLHSSSSQPVPASGGDAQQASVPVGGQGQGQGQSNNPGAVAASQRVNNASGIPPSNSNIVQQNQQRASGQTIQIPNENNASRTTNNNSSSSPTPHSNNNTSSAPTPTPPTVPPTTTSLPTTQTSRSNAAPPSTVPPIKTGNDTTEIKKTGHVKSELEKQIEQQQLHLQKLRQQQAQAEQQLQLHQAMSEITPSSNTMTPSSTSPLFPSTPAAAGAEAFVMYQTPQDIDELFSTIAPVEQQQAKALAQLTVDSARLRTQQLLFQHNNQQQHQALQSPLLQHDATHVPFLNSFVPSAQAQADDVFNSAIANVAAGSSPDVATQNLQLHHQQQSPSNPADQSDNDISLDVAPCV